MAASREVFSETNPPTDPALLPYWSRRSRISTDFAKGFRLDAEGLWSIKTEKAANAIAASIPNDSVFDAFAGCGGTAIAFARRGKRVVACDVSALRLRLARHNARVCAVLDRIAFIRADATAYWPKADAEAIYLDPPWGGPGYRSRTPFDQREIGTFLAPIIAHFKTTAISLPTAMDVATLPRPRGVGRTVIKHAIADGGFQTVFWTRKGG